MGQIITINPTGEVRGLRHKNGVDLRPLGKASIERTSDIQWSEDRQMWVVCFLTGKLGGNLLTPSLSKGDLSALKLVSTREEPLYYPEYEEAVQGEISAINLLRNMHGPDTV